MKYDSSLIPAKSDFNHQRCIYSAKADLVYHTTGQYKAARASQQYLGKGYTKAGQNRWVSKDGYRQIRWDTTHHMYKGNPSPAHFNWYEYEFPLSQGVRNKPIKDIHVWLKWFSYYI